jgi:hypothetical protein
MVKHILPLILGKLLLTITANLRKLCRNRKLFSRLTSLKLTFVLDCTEISAYQWPRIWQ